MSKIPRLNITPNSVGTVSVSVAKRDSAPMNKAAAGGLGSGSGPSCSIATGSPQPDLERGRSHGLAATPARERFHSDLVLDARRDGASLDPDPLSRKNGSGLVGATRREISFGPFRLIPAHFVLLESGKPVHLGSRALELLIALLERPGELITNQDLIARVWPDAAVGPSNLTVHISALRRALRDGRDGNRFIINVPRRGYMFVAAIQVSMRKS